MRLQRSLALLVLAAATAAPAFGQHHQQNADAAAFKPIDGGRRLDAFDDRMDRCVNLRRVCGRADGLLTDCSVCTC